MTGILSEVDAYRALGVWKELGLIRFAATPLLERVWDLRGAVTAYAAMYVAVAETLNVRWSRLMRGWLGRMGPGAPSR